MTEHTSVGTSYHDTGFLGPARVKSTNMDSFVKNMDMMRKSRMMSKGIRFSKFAGSKIGDSRAGSTVNTEDRMARADEE